ncbi:MAG: hypothetical protein NTW96_24905 [Planctomycetia bacterium]|nr:hypothetical protein [Planctomycetia bacterium]
MSTAYNIRRVEWHEDRPLDGGGFERYLITADRRRDGSWEIWERSTWDNVSFPPEEKDMTRLAEYAEHIYQQRLRRQRMWRDTILNWLNRGWPEGCSREQSNRELPHRQPADSAQRIPLVRRKEADRPWRVMPSLRGRVPRARSRLCPMHAKPIVATPTPSCPRPVERPAEVNVEDEVKILANPTRRQLGARTSRRSSE